MPATRDPTPEEIAELTAEIRSGWSERERLSRLRVDQRPTYQRCDGERLEMTSEDYNGHHSEREALTMFCESRTF